MLESKFPKEEFSTVRMTTKGDTDPRPLFAIDQKGAFEREIDAAVLDGRIDFAVHSLKDIPSSLPEGLVLASVPERGPAGDVVISGDTGGSGLDRIARGGIVGTSSLRRAVQIMRARPDLKVKPIRGNVETRIVKVGAGEYDAIILAKAGVDRLLPGTKYSDLPLDKFLPAPGQGALGVVARADEAGTVEMLKSIEEKDARTEVEAERALSQVIESGCRFPVGAHARSDGETVTLAVAAFSIDGKRSITIQNSSRVDRPEKLGVVTGEQMRKRGIDGLAAGWREALMEWNES